MTLLIALTPLAQLLNPPPPPPSTPASSATRASSAAAVGRTTSSRLQQRGAVSGYYKIGTGADTYDLFMGCGVLSAATCADTPVSDPVGMAVWWACRRRTRTAAAATG